MSKRVRFLVIVPVSLDGLNGRFCSCAAAPLIFVGMSVQDQRQGFDDDGWVHALIRRARW